MPALLRAVAVALLYIESRDFDLGHIGAAVEVLDVAQAPGLPPDGRLAFRVALLVLLPGSSTGCEIEVLQNGLSRRLALCGMGMTAKETKEKSGGNKTRKK
jgi:hypothetical protein